MRREEGLNSCLASREPNSDRSRRFRLQNESFTPLRDLYPLLRPHLFHFHPCFCQRRSTQPQIFRYFYFYFYFSCLVDEKLWETSINQNLKICFFVTCGGRGCGWCGGPCGAKVFSQLAPIMPTWFI